MHVVEYKGYRIYIACAPDGWLFHARPATPELSILPQADFRFFGTHDGAIDNAKARIDRVLML